MTSVSSIVIRYSRTKRMILFFLSGLMLVVGTGILIKSFGKKPYLNPYSMPIGVILLLGVVGIFIFANKLFMNKTAMVIDDNGVVDNSNEGSIGFIPWQDVLEVKKKKVAGRKFICLMVQNPNDYLSKRTSLIQQKRMEFNNTYCDTPVVISPKGLSMDYYTLLELIQRKHNLFKEQVISMPAKDVSIHYD